MLLAAVVIGCSGASEDDSFGGVDGGSESSSGRGRAGASGDDECDGECDGIGELGASAGRGAVDAGVEDAGEPVVTADSGQPDEQDKPCTPGVAVCVAGSCTLCGSEAGAGGSGGSGGSSAGSSAPACPDADDDDVCNADDKCPGSDHDDDGNGYADGCDKVLASFTLPAATKSVAASLSGVHGVRGTIGGFSMQLITTETSSAPKTISVDVEESDSAAEAADMMMAEAGTLSVALCVDSTSPSNPCWRLANQYVDLRSRSVVRFVAVISQLDLVADGSETDVTAGGRWEIRGY